MPENQQQRQRHRRQWQREQWTLLTASTMVLAGVAIAYVLWFTRSVMIPFVLAVFMVAVVSPIADFLESRLRLPRWLSIPSVLLVVLIGTLGLLLLLSYTAQEIYRSAERYANSVDFMQQGILDTVTDELPVGETDAVPPAGGENTPADVANDALIATPNENIAESGSLPPSPTGDIGQNQTDGTKPEAATTDGGASGNRLFSLLDFDRLNSTWDQLTEDLKTSLINFLKSAIGSAVGVFSTFSFMVVFVLFLLAARDPARIGSGMYTEIEGKIRRYLATKTALSTITGLLVGVILSCFGLELAAVFGVLTFLLNYIPSLGSIIATLLPLPVAYAQFQDWRIFLGILLLTGGVQMIIGNVIEPRIMGEGLDLHPITILFALAFWGLLWGPVGAILAVPITAVIRIAIARFKSLQPVANLMAGRLPS